jgi:hypothetical protein
MSTPVETPSGDTPSEGFTGWAVLELFGHRVLGGFVRPHRIAGTEMLRIEVPWSDPAKGTRATQFYSGSAVFSLTPTDEANARIVAGRTEPYEYTPAARQLEEPGEDDDDDGPEQDPDWNEVENLGG